MKEKHYNSKNKLDLLTLCAFNVLLKLKMCVCQVRKTRNAKRYISTRLFDCFRPTG